MKEEMRLYWESYKENVSNELILHTSFNPLRDFEDEFINGPILEIGCGQSNFILEYSQTGREIFAIDNDQYQLNELKDRISKLKVSGKINYLNLTFLEDPLPKETYSVIILSNIMHFFSMKDCKIIVDELIKLSTNGTIIYTINHSLKSPYNNPENPENNSYFKHFFSEEDLELLFENKQFERLFFADIQRKKSKLEIEVIEKWIHKLCDRRGNYDTDYRNRFIKAQIGDNLEADLYAMYRFK